MLARVRSKKQAAAYRSGVAELFSVSGWLLEQA
eukprot:COSAG04_NODE_875_length_9692_cov_6.365266_2_plen_33_part_00